LGLHTASITGLGLIDSVDLSEGEMPLWFSAATATQHLPLYIMDQGLAVRYSITHAGLLAAHYATKEYPTFTLLPYNIYMNAAWFSSYEMYKIVRARARPGVYNSNWQGYGVKELSIAPFKWKNIKQPIFIVPVGLSLIGAISKINSSEQSIFKNGKAFIDGEEWSVDRAVPLMLGINALQYIGTAIGEEALYRGVIYEELKATYGPKKAKLYDFFLFPAMHLPIDIARELKPFDIGKQFVVRGTVTLLFDYAYDKGGLPLSVAIHTWFNFLSFTSTWMAEGGALSPGSENQNKGDAEMSKPPLMVNYTFRF